MADTPAPPPRSAGTLLRRAAFAVCAVGVMTAAILGVGTPAWAAGGVGFLLVGISKFPFHRPSRWRLAGAVSRWWAAPSLAAMLVLVSFAASGVFHSFGLLVRAAWSRMA
jgi:hypothetical protein